MSKHDWEMTSQEYDDAFFRCRVCKKKANCRRGYPDKDGCQGESEEQNMNKRIERAISNYDGTCGWALDLFASYNQACALAADKDPGSEAGKVRMIALQAITNIYLSMRAEGLDDAEARSAVEALAPRALGI